MTFLLLSLILNFVDRPHLMAFTGAAVGSLVAFFVFVEAPVSGASLNPARTLGPAVVGSTFTDLWVYLVGPPLGALSAALLYRQRRSTVACAKLHHTDSVVCRFLNCRYTPRHHRTSSSARPTHSASSISGITPAPTTAAWPATDVPSVKQTWSDS